MPLAAPHPHHQWASAHYSFNNGHFPHPPPPPYNGNFATAQTDFSSAYRRGAVAAAHAQNAVAAAAVSSESLASPAVAASAAAFLGINGNAVPGATVSYSHLLSLVFVINDPLGQISNDHYFHFKFVLIHKFWKVWKNRLTSVRPSGSILHTYGHHIN